MFAPNMKVDIVSINCNDLKIRKKFESYEINFRCINVYLQAELRETTDGLLILPIIAWTWPGWTLTPLSAIFGFELKSSYFSALEYLFGKKVK